MMLMMMMMMISVCATMHLLLVFSFLIVILSGSHDVYPGDPFPKEIPLSKTLTSDDMISTKDQLSDPSDDVIPSKVPSELDPPNSIGDEKSFLDSGMIIPTKLPMTDQFDSQTTKNESHSMEMVSTSTKSTVISEFSDNIINDQNRLNVKTTITIESSKPLISKMNLIKIARWKYEDIQTQTSRYWYEPEGGRMGLGWAFDGYVFQAYSKPMPNTYPVYAFHSEIRALWTNTVQLDPKAPAIGESQWVADGISFYAYKTPMNSTELRPVFRYWNRLKAGVRGEIEIRSTYLTTKVDEEDKSNIDRSEWIFDHILFYALPFDDKMEIN